MTFEKWLTKHDTMLRRTARKFGGEFWQDDLYQTMLIKLWGASIKYGDDFQRSAGQCIRNAVSDHLRFLKRNLFCSLDFDTPACEEAFQYDWQTIFDIGHGTRNLTAVRFMRSVLNPDKNQLQREEQMGGFNWNIVIQTVGLDRRKMRHSFRQLKNDIISTVGDVEALYLEEA